MVDYDKLTPFLGLVRYDPADPTSFYRILDDNATEILGRYGNSDSILVPYQILPKQHIKDNVVHYVIKTQRLPFQIKIQEIPKKYALESIKALSRWVAQSLSLGIIPFDLHEGNLLYWWRYNKPCQTYFVDLDGCTHTTLQYSQVAYIRLIYLLYKYVLGINIPTHMDLTFDTMHQYIDIKDWPHSLIHEDFTQLKVWHKVINHIDRITLPEHEFAEWADNYALAPESELAKNPKIAKVLQILEGIKDPSKTLLDVGCNKGYVQSLSSKWFKYLMGVDYEVKCIEHAIDTHTQQNIAFSKLDIRLFAESDVLPAISRYRADIVVILALTHHLDTLKIDAVQSATSMARLANKYILIEDIVNVLDYHNVFRAHGFKLVNSCDSYPNDRKLSLWVKG